MAVSELVSATAEVGFPLAEAGPAAPGGRGPPEDDELDLLGSSFRRLASAAAAASASASARRRSRALRHGTVEIGQQTPGAGKVLPLYF